MILLDDQFKYDFTEWYILLFVMYSFGVVLAIIISILIKQAARDQEQEEALEFLVRQAEHYGLYDHEYQKTHTKDLHPNESEKS